MRTDARWVHASFEYSRTVLRAGRTLSWLTDQAQALLIRLEDLLSALTVFDVGVGSEPFDNPAIIVERWSRTEQKPAIHAIEAAQAIGPKVWLTPGSIGRG